MNTFSWLSCDIQLMCLFFINFKNHNWGWNLALNVAYWWRANSKLMNLNADHHQVCYFFSLSPLLGQKYHEYVLWVESDPRCIQRSRKHHSYQWSGLWSFWWQSWSGRIHETCRSQQIHCHTATVVLWKSVREHSPYESWGQQV